MDAIVCGPGEGELLEGEHRKLRINASLPELDVLEFELEPGFEGPGAHFHRKPVDSFYVLDGEGVFRIGHEEVVAGPGTFVAAPPGVVHAFTASDRPARFLNVHAPDRGFTEYLRARARNEDVDPADYDIVDVEE